MLRLLSRGTQVAIDLAVLALAFWLAFLLRFEFELKPELLKRILFLWPWVVLLQYMALHLVGVPRAGLPR